MRAVFMRKEPEIEAFEFQVEKVITLPAEQYAYFTQHLMKDYDFIKENVHLKNQIIVIIHGIGSGIIYNETKITLARNKYVKDYKTYYYNNGCTVVELQFDKNF